MRLWCSVTLFPSLFLLPVSLAAAQAPDKPDSGANAALKYWTAFAFLPSEKNQEELLEHWDKIPFDAAALGLIEKSRASRAYLHRAAMLQRCDWSLNLEDGIRLELPYLGKLRTLSKLTALHARHEFEQGHWQAGAEAVSDLLKMAGHLEMDQMIIPQVVGYAIERTAIAAAAPYLPELKAVFPEAIAPVLDAVPAGPTLAQLVLREKQIAGQWLIKELRQVEQHRQGAWAEVWKEVFTPREAVQDDRDLVNAAKTFEEAIKLLETLLPFYDELAKLAALPGKEFDAQYPEFVMKAKAASPLADFVLPNIGKFVNAQRRAQTQRALFKAALAVVAGGPDKLKDIPDPFGDGPFTYQALDKGFELKSKLLDGKDKPLKLTVGQRQKE
jgi:hypothetical protein